MAEFKLLKITLEGFRTFKQKQVFQLDREPGLYFITGNNLDDTRLGGNGVGKSTIADAISWCLFNKTVRGLRGSVIKNWTAEHCLVSLEFLKDDLAYIITRTQNPNSLTISPPILANGELKEVVVQEDIDNFLGIDYNKFLYILIAGQLTTSFLDLGPTDKLNLVSDVMSLDFWEQRSKDASTNAISMQNTSNVVEAEKKGREGKAEALKAEREALKANSERFENGRLEELARLEEYSKTLFQEISDAEKKTKLCTSQLNNCDDAVDRLKEDIRRIKSNIESIEGDSKTIQELLITAINNKSNTKAEFDKWKTIDICPYCDTKIEANTVTIHKNEATKSILRINKEIKFFRSKEANLNMQRKVNEDKLAETEELLNIERLKHTGLEKELAKLSTVKELKTKELTNNKKTIEDLKTGMNPYSELIELSFNKLKDLDEELGKINDKLDLLNKDITGNQFWVKGFKELRLWIVSDALLALEIETNNTLAKLGLPHWKLKFQLERETTTGNLSKGFHVFVKPPSVKDSDYVPFEVWSGGETQRLKLASVVGLSELIQNYKGVNFNISIFDEPTSFLSGSGIEELIEFLHEKAISNGKVIYYIDHHHLESTYFSSVINVEKTKEGSRIIE